jgi:hypothetical protein
VGSVVLGRVWPWIRGHVPLLASGLAGLVVLALVVTMIPREKNVSIPVREVLRQATELDGHEVRLRGVIGQTFPVGEGHTFYLHDGRDTIVVFTRVRTPVEKEKVRLVGTVSTGFLDGVPRPAIFETRLDSKH